MSIFMKYYMNNPCTVVRALNDEISEVVVDISYAADLDGGQFCMGCELGGTVSHTCEDTQDVIDAVADEVHNIPLLVENRLLADRPIEVGIWAKINAEIESAKAKLAGFKPLMKEWEDMFRLRRNQVKEFDARIAAQKNSLDSLCDAETQLIAVRDKLTGQCDALEVKIHATSDVITGAEYRRLKERDALLTRLEHLGVDNWEGWDDANT